VTTTPRFDAHLSLDAAREADRIASAIRMQVATFKRRGVVLGLSGGIDSSVSAALAVRGLGTDRVLGLLMPERESAPESLTLGQMLGQHLGIRTIVEDVTPILEAAGCYGRRDAAIRTVVPDYGEGFKSKVVLSTAPRGHYRVFNIVAEAPDGRQTEVRLTADASLAIVAATNFKQRARKMIEYHYADRYQYAVIGTPNRLEYDQGFFVKNGDGAADLKPIAHLYKTQVYQLAEYLGIPNQIRRRPPTTDTFPLEQSQEEFYFLVPLAALDHCLHGLDHGLPASDVAARAGLALEQVESIYRDIEAKRRTTAYLHAPAVVLSAPSTGNTTQHWIERL
jgi:NAD+ synthase